MKMCSCRTCRRGLRTKGGSDLVRQAVRSERRKAKTELKQGKTPANNFSVEYTD